MDGFNKPGGVVGITPNSQNIYRIYMENVDQFNSHVYTTAGVQQGGPPHIVADTATLSGGTVTITLAGLAIFSSATSYIVTATNRSNPNALKVIKNSGSSITITSAGATDVVDFICLGN